MILSVKPHGTLLTYFPNSGLNSLPSRVSRTDTTVNTTRLEADSDGTYIVWFILQGQSSMVCGRRVVVVLFFILFYFFTVLSFTHRSPAGKEQGSSKASPNKRPNITILMLQSLVNWVGVRRECDFSVNISGTT